MIYENINEEESENEWLNRTEKIRSEKKRKEKRKEKKKEWLTDSSRE